MAAGRVVLLNGTPSSGKSTLAHALHEVLDPPHWYRSFEDFRLGYLDRHWDPHRGHWYLYPQRPFFMSLLDGFLGSVAVMARAGHHVLTEAVILPGSRDLYADRLRGLQVFLIGVRCPLPVAIERERARADRVKGVPLVLDVPEFDLVHAHGAYDADVDTSCHSVAESVAMVMKALSRPSTAFGALGPGRRMV